MTINTDKNEPKQSVEDTQQLAATKEATSMQPRHYNAVLDDEQHLCTAEFLQFVDDSHLLKKLAIDIAKASHLPEHTTFLAGLAVFSSIACRKYKVDYQHDKSLPIGLYVVMEQPSGTGKSRALHLFQQPFNQAEIDNSKHIKSELSRLKGIENLTDEDKALSAKLGEKQLPFFTTNSTPEALEETLKHTNGFFSAISSEQGLFNSILGLSYKSDGNNKDLLLNGFDAGYINSIRLSREGYCGNVIGSVVMFAQPGSIEKILGESNGTGLAERFLLLAEKHKLGTRDHTKQARIDDNLLLPYNLVCNFLASNILAKKREYNDLVSLKICNDGHILIAKYQNTIESHLADGGKYSHISLRGAAGKINMQIMKISANLHILDQDSVAIDAPETIDIKYVQTAISIADALIEANLKLCMDKGIIGLKAEYRAVLTYLEKRHKPTDFHTMNNSLRKTVPFKDLTGNKSDAIRKTLDSMVKDKLISKSLISGVYSIS